MIILFFFSRRKKLRPRRSLILVGRIRMNDVEKWLMKQNAQRSLSIEQQEKGHVQLQQRSFMWRNGSQRNKWKVASAKQRRNKKEWI